MALLKGWISAEFVGCKPICPLWNLCFLRFPPQIDGRQKNSAKLCKSVGKWTEARLEIRTQHFRRTTAARVPNPGNAINPGRSIKFVLFFCEKTSPKGREGSSRKSNTQLINLCQLMLNHLRGTNCGKNKHVESDLCLGCGPNKESKMHLPYDRSKD